jgi:branched-chain amino acid transport system ATP-binding protein
VNHILEIHNLSKSFGRIMAVQDVSFSVAPNEIRAIIGPNGAGKTTLFNLISGATRSDGGSVVFDGRPKGFVKNFSGPQFFSRALGLGKF